MADDDAPARRGHGVEHAIERAVLAVEQQIVLAVEVVIQVRGRQVRRLGDVAHAGVGEAALAEQLRRGAEDGVALAVAAARARRRRADVNGCSIFEPRFIIAATGTAGKLNRHHRTMIRPAKAALPIWKWSW